MEVLDTIPLHFDMQAVKKNLRIKEETSSPDSINELLETAYSLIQLRAVYKTAFIEERGENSVKIDGMTFSSRVLKVNLNSIERIFPYIITAGADLENEAGSCGDIMKQYYLETLADMALGSGEKFLENHLKEKYGVSKLSSMSPGSLAEWPITEQKPLFSLFGEKIPVGVSLTDHMLMIPRKSISGLFFPTEVDFFSCQLCERAQCPGRKAPYDKSVKEKYKL